MTLREQLLQSKQQLENNLRLRLGVWSIVFIALIYIALVISDQVALEEQAYIDNIRQVERLIQAQSESDWPTRLTAEQGLSERLSQRFWSAKTVGLAQAQLQSEIETLIEQSGLKGERIRIGVAQLVSTAPDLWRVQVEVNARFNAESLEQLLIDLSKLDKALSVDTLQVSARGSRQISMRLSAYFKDIEE